MSDPVLDAPLTTRGKLRQRVRMRRFAFASVFSTLFLAVLLALSTIIVIPWVLFTAGIFVYLVTRVAVFVVDEVMTAGAPPRPVD